MACVCSLMKLMEYSTLGLVSIEGQKSQPFINLQAPFTGLVYSWELGLKVPFRYSTRTRPNRVPCATQGSMHCIIVLESFICSSSEFERIFTSSRGWLWKRLVATPYGIQWCVRRLESINAVDLPDHRKFNVVQGLLILPGREDSRRNRICLEGSMWLAVFVATPWTFPRNSSIQQISDPTRLFSCKIEPIINFVEL